MYKIILITLSLLFLLIITYYAFLYYMSPNTLDKDKARAILNTELNKYKEKSYHELLPLLDEKERLELQIDDRAEYQLVFDALWDDQKGGNLRVIGSIDDGGRSAYIPETASFIISPENKFIDE